MESAKLWTLTFPTKRHHPARRVGSPGSASAHDGRRSQSLIRPRQQRYYNRCSLIYKCPLVSGWAPLPAYPASTPPSKPVRPLMIVTAGGELRSPPRGGNKWMRASQAEGMVVGQSEVRRGPSRLGMQLTVSYHQDITRMAGIFPFRVLYFIGNSHQTFSGSG